MQVAFIGAGKMAGTLMEKVDEHDDVDVTAICDINEEAARAAAEPRGAAVYTDHEALFRDKSTDAVFVAIPPFAYDDQLTLAAEHGVDLFVEKPVGLRPERAAEVGVTLEESGVITGTGYVFRYDKITEKALELLADRTINLIDARYWSGLLASPWGNELERSGGEIGTRSTHVYDTIRYFGGDVESVCAAGTTRTNVEEIDYHDATSATMTHENGAISHVSSGVTSPDWKVEVDLLADDCRLRLDYAAQQLTGVIGEEPVEYEYETDRYGREINAFLEAVRTGDRDLVRSDYADAVRTLELTSTVVDSATEGRPIDL